MAAEEREAKLNILERLRPVWIGESATQEQIRNVMATLAMVSDSFRQHVTYASRWSEEGTRYSIVFLANRTVPGMRVPHVLMAEDTALVHAQEVVPVGCFRAVLGVLEEGIIMPSDAVLDDDGQLTFTVDVLPPDVRVLVRAEWHVPQ